LPHHEHPPSPIPPLSSLWSDFMRGAGHCCDGRVHSRHPPLGRRTRAAGGRGAHRANGRIGGGRRARLRPAQRTQRRRRGRRQRAGGAAAVQCGRGGEREHTQVRGTGTSGDQGLCLPSCPSLAVRRSHACHRVRHAPLRPSPPPAPTAWRSTASARGTAAAPASWTSSPRRSARPPRPCASERPRCCTLAAGATPPAPALASLLAYTPFPCDLECVSCACLVMSAGTGGRPCPP